MSSPSLNVDEHQATVAGRKRLQKQTTQKGSQWMEDERKNIQAYEYLCHIGEAKE